MSKVVVTGSAGFIGGHLTDRLLRLGIEVLGIDDMSSGLESTRKLHMTDRNFRSEEIDIGNSDISTIFENFKPEYVFHLAAKPGVTPSVENPTFSDLNNINGTVNLLEAAKNAGVKRFIFSSSSSIYGGSTDLPTKEALPANPKSPYALQKLTGEKYCEMFSKLYAMDTASLRYFNVFGPRQRSDSAYAAVIAAFCDAEKKGVAPVIFGSGEQFRDFCYVENVVDANIEAALAESPLRGEVFNVGCGGRITVNELCEKICSISPTYKEKRAGDVFCSQADISKARAYLGYNARHSFEEGIKKTLSWHLDS